MKTTSLHKAISVTETPSYIHIKIPKRPAPPPPQKQRGWDALVGIAGDDELTHGKTSVELQHLLWKTPKTPRHS